jgi:hypothetical protein
MNSAELSSAAESGEDDVLEEDDFEEGNRNVISAFVHGTGLPQPYPHSINGPSPYEQTSLLRSRHGETAAP